MQELTIEEIRRRLEEAMETGPLPDWLDEACARLVAHRRMRTKERIYDVSTVGARIRTARESVGYTQKQLANRCGIWPPEMSAIENGKRDLEARFIRRLANALRITEAWMLMESDEGGPPIPERLLVKVKRVGWNQMSAKAKHKQIARAELERCKGLRPPRVIDDGGEPRDSPA